MSDPWNQVQVIEPCPFGCSTELEVVVVSRKGRPGQGYEAFAVVCPECGTEGPHVWDEWASSGITAAIARWRQHGNILGQT